MSAGNLGMNTTDTIVALQELTVWWGADTNNHNVVVSTLELCKSDGKVLCLIRGNGIWW